MGMTSERPGLDRPIPFGRYELSRLIASGGMGEVYLARSQGAAGIEKEVVIKKILPHLASEPEFVERFIDEARLVVGLSHGNIAQVFDMGKEGDEYFIAMEYVDGCDLRVMLRRCLAQGVKVPIQLVLYLIGEIAQGLSYAHSRRDASGESLRIVHRDVSPANVMVSRDGGVKLVDFGVAKAKSKLSRSITGSVRGKFQYMSPEQARGDELSAASDMFSLGVLTYELLSGFRPFDANSDMKILENVKEADPRSLRDIVPEISPVVETLVHSCLDKDPARRPTGDGLRRDLLGQIHEMTSGAGVTAQDLGRFMDQVLSFEPAQDSVSIEDALEAQLQLSSGAGDPGTATLNPQQMRVPSVLPPVIHQESSWTSPEVTRQQAKNVRSLQSLVMVLAGIVVLLLMVNTWLFLSGTDAEFEGVELTESSTQNVVVPKAVPESSQPTPNVKVSSPKAEEDPVPVVQEVRREAAPTVARTRKGLVGLSDTVSIKLFTVPASARINVPGRPPSRGPVMVTIKKGERLHISARETGYKTAHVIVRSDANNPYRIVLVKERRGEVRFRYFPANSLVFLDGKKLQTGGTNVVKKSLIVGEHVVEIQALGQKERVRRKFSVTANETTQLGTIQ